MTHRYEREAAIAIQQCEAHPEGPAGVVRDGEIAAGYKIVPVGSYFPFRVPEEDWEHDCVISANGNEARIVLVLAKRPGSFRRLIENIQRMGMTPVVVSPCGPTMQKIMKKWGWVETIRGEGWEKVDEWRPPA